MDHLAKTIKGLLKKSQKLRRMGKAAREYVEQRSIDTTFLQTWDMYRRQSLMDDLCESHKAG